MIRAGMWSAPPRVLPPSVARALVVTLVGVSVAVVAAAIFLAGAHVDDRFDVGPASGAWLGLAAAARAGVWYPAAFAHGFYGGTRYMPLPIVLELVARAIGGSFLAPDKIAVFATNVALYGAVYVAARRRGAPMSFALAIVGTILTTSAAATSLYGIRFDAVASLLELVAAMLVAERTARHAVLAAALLCGVAVAAKISALWAPAAILVWLARRSLRMAALFAAATAATIGLLTGAFELLSDGRLVQQLRAFAFAGSLDSSYGEGVHRIYQLALRNERAAPLLLIVGAAAVAVAFLRRRAQVYELGFVFSLPILVVVMRDYGTYENHLLDLEVLAGLAVAGLWGDRTAGWTTARAATSLCLLAALAAAGRHTLAPDARAAIAHAVHGRPDPRYAIHPVPGIAAEGTCALFEDASIPILAGQRPVVLDAFIVHRLQTADPAALTALERRVDRRAFSSIVLDVPLTNTGWFATIDFGTRLARAMQAYYRLVRSDTSRGLYVYAPRRATARSCTQQPLSRWRSA